MMLCDNCDQEVSFQAAQCMNCGHPTGAAPSSKSRLTYILLGFFFGIFGIHNFYAGYTFRGMLQLLFTVLLGWLVFPLMGVAIWVILEICIMTRDSEGKTFAS